MAIPTHRAPLQSAQIRVRNGDMRLERSAGRHIYPDSNRFWCGPLLGADETMLRNPFLAVEVFSPNIADHDRRSRLGLHRSTPSQRGNRAVHEFGARTDANTRADGPWRHRSTSAMHGVIPLALTGCERPRAAGYRGSAISDD